MQKRMWTAAALAVVIAAWGNPAASAAAVQYEWDPIGGGGTYSKTGGPFVPYESYNGYLIINYDPNNIANDSVSGFVGGPVDRSFGGGGSFDTSFQVGLTGDSLYFSDNDLGAVSTTFSIALTGDPGPLTPGGLPENLNGFVDQWAGVRAARGSTDGTGFFFYGVAGAGAPEPSSLLMLALGLGGAMMVRRGRRHPAPDRPR